MSHEMRPAGLTGMFGLSGKSALVVDKNGNAGIDVAVALTEAGAQVTFVERDQAIIDKVILAAKERGGIVRGILCDVENEAAVLDLFRELETDRIPIDIFVSCCGLTTNAPLETMTAGFWEDAQMSNLKCVFFCAREAINRMVK